MIYDRYYITTPALWTSNAISLSKSVIVLPVNLASTEELRKLYSIASNQLVEQRFCLLLDIGDISGEPLLSDLIAFFFFPNYKVIKGSPEVVILAQNSSKKEHFVSLLTEAAKAQGFNSIHLSYFRGGGIDEVHVYRDNNPEALRVVYRTHLKEPVSPFFIKVEQFSELEMIHGLLEEEEALFQQQEPVLYRLLQENSQLQAKVEELELLTAAAAQEIAGQAEHMNVLRSQSQATHLQHYYTNEYEVLPGWYKRLGHVLKVVMGKRSFRSLFDDNVKKYKQ